MEENNNFSWMELVFGTGTNCQFCGVVTLEQHKDSCPAKLININWATQTLFANLQGYENFDELDNPELNEVIGRQLMMIADAILHMQREWSTKLLTDQAEEVLNNWSMISQFCEALVDADVLRSKKSVLKFVKNPTQWGIARLYASVSPNSKSSKIDATELKQGRKEFREKNKK